MLSTLKGSFVAHILLRSQKINSISFGLLVVAPFLFRGPKSLPLVFALPATEQVKAVLFVVYLTKIAYR